MVSDKELLDLARRRVNEMVDGISTDLSLTIGGKPTFTPREILRQYHGELITLRSQLAPRGGIR